MVLTEKLKKRLSVIFILYLLGAFILAIYLNNRSISYRSNNFYSHKIIGKISAISMLNSRIEIKLMSDKNKYDFYQNRSSYQKNDFYKSAKEGDSIFKNAYSDTVLIKGSDQMKSYIIEHP